MPKPPDDLFEAALQDRLKSQAPLAARMRPQTLDDMVGQRHLLAPGRPLRSLIDTDKLSSIILWGPPGTGKTTLARLIASTTNRHFVPLSAVTAGVKDVRDTVEIARRHLAEDSRGTILFLDEVHRFNKSQQDALLPSVEEGVITLIGATTENPFFEVNAPLLSRSTLFRLEPLGVDDLSDLIRRALGHERSTADDDAVKVLADLVEGDARAALTSLEVALAIAGADSRTHLTVEDIEAARSTRAIRYEEDEHYDIISAFIKSIRGSDVDAGIYWLMRMISAGEDARYIARRLVVLASEDVGMADPMALVVADAAARAVEFVGLPEAQFNLVQAVIHLATAPKSNSVKMALAAVNADLQGKPLGAVPPPLRDASYRQARRIGHGKGYLYPHDDPRGWVEQQYRPDEVQDSVYYEPKAHGEERARAADWRRRTNRD